jgi:hypothetical protein
MVIKAADNTGKLSSTNQSYTGRELAVCQGSPFPMTVAQLSMAAGNQLIRDLGRKLSDFMASTVSITVSTDISFQNNGYVNLKKRLISTTFNSQT